MALAQAEFNKSWGTPTADSLSQIGTPDGAGVNPQNMNMVAHNGDDFDDRQTKSWPA